MEIIATLTRWSQLVANLVLFGSCVFLTIAGTHRALFNNSWVLRLERIFPLLAGIVLIGLVGVLATTTGEATGVDANTWRPAAWFAIVQNTKMGHMWAIRAVCAVFLLGITLFIYYVRPRVRWHYAMGAIVASLPLIASALVSHSAADENFLFYVSIYAIHILLAGIWFGALPAFLLIIFDKQNNDTKGIQLKLNIESLKKFSFVALPVMAAIMLTGLVVTDRMVDDGYHALVASSYGWVLNTKLALLVIVLLIAQKARSKWLPLFEKFEQMRKSIDLSGLERKSARPNRSFFSFKRRMEPPSSDEQEREYTSDITNTGVVKLKKWVRIEFIFALFLVLFATILSNTKPAKHAMVENWPYPFRFTIDGTLGAGLWGAFSVQLFLWLGLVLLITAIGSIWLGKRNKWNIKKKVGIPLVLSILAAIVILPQFAVKAYSETYQNTPVPFDAISISNGSVHFSEYCSSCHGSQGKGNGILAKTFTPPPADLLTEPHTARHTAGDFFHWISYGLENTGMPGFASSLSEEDRWDAVNYIHAMSRGYQARLLNPAIVPEKPSIGPPVFQFTTYDDSTGTLKDYRQRANLLLVFFSWPDSLDRLQELSENYEKLRNLNTEILAVPLDEYSDTVLKNFASESPVPLVRDGWLEVRNSYILFRRTLTHPDILGEGDIPDHMEFLIDRFGYLRARWIPVIDDSGWDNLPMLTNQLLQLNQEEEILPPPRDHVH